MPNPEIELPTVEVIAGELETPKLSGNALLTHIDGLKGRYKEPWRHHHVFDHPLSLFTELIKHKEELDDPVSVAWAIMYHDAIYDPVAEPGRNEELSALLAERETPLFLAVNGVRKVADFTRATTRHHADIPDSDLEFFLDADLAILGQPPQRYKVYADAIREEYRHVALEQYIPARINILIDLAHRHEGRAVYATEVFREEYEEQAQTNIAAEIEFLSGRS